MEELSPTIGRYTTFASLEGQTDAGTATDTELSEDEVKNILNAGVWFLRFPAPLENIYRVYARARSIKTYRFNGLMVLVLFAVIVSSVFRLIPPESLAPGIRIYAFAISVMMGVRILSFIRAFDRWFNWYVTISGTIVVAIGVYANNTILLGAATTLSYVGLTYILLFVYCFVGLRVQLGMISGWMGGLLGVIMTYADGGEMDWLTMPQTFATASILGMFLAYGLGRQERINFLQSYLLQKTLSTTEKLSREDYLTGLANRRFLKERMELEWNRMQRHGLPMTIMIIDIDFFKVYNDSLGHIAGDRCLTQVAHLIRGLAHRSGELAARYGGEEFVLLFPNMDREMAEGQAQRLLDRAHSLAIPHPDREGGIVTLSAGISVCIPKPSMNVDQLLRQADIALYKAKSNGRNRFEFF
jgi:diguanylate cyclase (GGDEF)-like protein